MLSSSSLRGNFVVGAVTLCLRRMLRCCCLLSLRCYIVVGDVAVFFLQSAFSLFPNLCTLFHLINIIGILPGGSSYSHHPCPWIFLGVKQSFPLSWDTKSLFVRLAHRISLLIFEHAPLLCLSGFSAVSELLCSIFPASPTDIFTWISLSCSKFSASPTLSLWSLFNCAALYLPSFSDRHLYLDLSKLLWVFSFSDIISVVSLQLRSSALTDIITWITSSCSIFSASPTLWQASHAPIPKDLLYLSSYSDRHLYLHFFMLRYLFSFSDIISHRCQLASTQGHSQKVAAP